MSQGSVVDYQINIVPSEKLLKFISTISVGSKSEQIPKNIVKILQTYGVNCNEYKIEDCSEMIVLDDFTEKEDDIINEFKLELSDFKSAFEFFKVEADDVTVNEDNEEHTDENNAKTNKKIKEQVLLNFNDLKWINRYLVKERKSCNSNVYLHEIVEGSTLILPKNEIIPRNPELEERCQKLKEEQANRVYRSMTKDVDSLRRTLPEDTISYQLKSMNSQIIAVLQFVFSVAAGFTFGFLGVELIIGNLDFGFRLLLGIICALTIALAEIYFLAKKLNELDDLKDEIVPPPKRKID